MTSPKSNAIAMTESGRPERADRPQLELRLRLAERAYERLNLCPDHRDKASGTCIVCEAERRTAQESAALRSRAEWQDMETAPRNGTQIALWGVSANTAKLGFWWEGNFQNPAGWRAEGVGLCYPTKWMPLPAPPAATPPHSQEKP